MTNLLQHRLRDLWRVLAAPEPDLTRGAVRMRIVERDVGLAVKSGVLLNVGWFLFFSLNIEAIENTSEVGLEIVGALRQIFIIYAVVNLALALPIWAFSRVPLKVMQWVVFTIALLDAMFLAALTLVTDGFDSILFWVFPLLALRNALTMPVAALQISLNLLSALAYVAAGVLDLWILRLDEQTEVSRATEPFLLRILLLMLLGAIFYQLQVLLDRDRESAAEAAEFALRQHQMSAAGRLAAEIAHQIKNPLGIINNAAFALQRSLPAAAANSPATQQLRIIREEVERSDQIITELIGFAQLAEGRIERLDAVEELEASVLRVFPPGASFTTEIRRDYRPPLPPLLFSRRNLGEVFDNLLKNARDVLDGRGQIRLGVHANAEMGIEVTVTDNGPGIPAENRERIFEAYFTTKPSGTGLGLAIVKQNLELFGGRVEVESEAGRGSCFRLVFPGRSTLRLKA